MGPATCADVEKTSNAVSIATKEQTLLSNSHVFQMLPTAACSTTNAPNMAVPESSALHRDPARYVLGEQRQPSRPEDHVTNSSTCDIAFRVLEQAVQDHLNQYHRHLWTSLDQGERHLRRRCLRDRLCR